MTEETFLTIRQITDMAKRGNQKPRTMAGWRRIAKEKRWDSFGENICRTVDGERHYNVRLLPRAMRRLFAPPKPDVKAILEQRANDIRNARSVIVSALENYAEANGGSMRTAILAFVGAVDETSRRQLPASILRIEEFDLPYTILREAKEWCKPGERWVVSRDTIYRWVREARVTTDTPKTVSRSGAQNGIEEGIRRTGHFLRTAPDAVLAAFVTMEEPRIVEILRERGYTVERVLSEPVLSQR